MGVGVCSRREEVFVAALCEENESEQKNACIAFSAVEKTPLLACVVTRESCVREGRCFENNNICLCEQTIRATRAHREREGGERGSEHGDASQTGI